jgi:hypothetical protein
MQMREKLKIKQFQQSKERNTMNYAINVSPKYNKPIA